MTTPGSSVAALADQIRAIRLVVFDFDGVFTDNGVYVFDDGSEAVRCFRGDGLGLRKLERVGIEPMILSTESNPIVSVRARKLGVACVQACDDKLAALERLASARRLSLAQVAFVGNDVNDRACLAAVGLPIVVGDAHPDVLGCGRYRTSAPGGHGAVREVCDLIERVLAGATV